MAGKAPRGAQRGSTAAPAPRGRAARARRNGARPGKDKTGPRSVLCCRGSGTGAGKRLRGLAPPGASLPDFIGASPRRVPGLPREAPRSEPAPSSPPDVFYKLPSARYILFSNKNSAGVLLGAGGGHERFVRRMERAGQITGAKPSGHALGDFFYKIRGVKGTGSAAAPRSGPEHGRANRAAAARPSAVRDRRVPGASGPAQGDLARPGSARGRFPLPGGCRFPGTGLGRVEKLSRCVAAPFG